MIDEDLTIGSFGVVAENVIGFDECETSKAWEDEFARSGDTINHPSHYNTGGIECIDAIDASMKYEEFAGYLKGNILKYVWRYKEKNGVEDLEKARWYLNKLIEVEQ